MSKIIAVSNLKGGVGKTMTAASLGAGHTHNGKVAKAYSSFTEEVLQVA